jgi:hypothetical protein
MHDEIEPKIEGPLMLACRTEEFDQLLKLAKVSSGTPMNYPRNLFSCT